MDILNKNREETQEEAHPLISRHTKLDRTKETPKIVRASVKFTLPDKNGNNIEYLGLLDTGSTHGLISQELAKKNTS